MKKISTLIFFQLGLCLHLLAGLTPVSLLCEYTVDPTVVDVIQPRLCWVNLASEGERGQRQTAWQIRVASSHEKLEQADLWDSGKVPGEQSTRIKYAGTPLVSRQDCWWQVRVWDRHDKVSDWSEPAFWHMGLLIEDDWNAQWIGVPWQGEETLPKPGWPGDFLPGELPPPAPLLRKEFQINKSVERAMVYTTGLGYFELYVNGAKVGDDVLVPNQTNYGKRDDLMEQNIPLPDDFADYKVMYLAYDITNLLVTGSNAIGSILATRLRRRTVMVLPQPGRHENRP